MPELDVDFEITTNNLETEYEISEGEHFDCSFEIYASGTTFSSIMGSPYDNEALTEALNQKADNSTVETLSETVTNNYNTLDGKIDTHIADKTNPHEVTKAQVGLGNVDNTSDLNKPISTATQTALNGKQDIISDLSTIRTNASNGQSAYNTIQTYGDIVTYDASNFATSVQGQKADTALQPNDNITELNNNAGYITGIDSEDVTDALGYTPYNSTNPAGYQENVIESIEVNGTAQTITSKTVDITVPTDTSDLTNGAGYITSASLPTVNNPTITFQKNGSTVESITLNQSNNETINFSIPTTASDINAVPTSREINGHALTNDINLTYSDVGALSDTTTINDLTTTAQQNALNSGATTTNIGQIATNTQAISDETTARENADLGLQQQIDAIVSSSDVFDIVGTYAELQAYDISTVPVNDIIKVLVDSTHNNAATYYRCTESGGVKSWTYIGSEGAYYTKSEADAEFVPQTRTVNNKALSSNITLDATDVGALPSSTTIGSGVLTVQKNGTTIDTFGANDTGNTTVNITVPTDTNDLTNGAGFITNSALSNYATQTNLTNGLATKQDTLIAGTDLEIIPAGLPILPEGYTQIEYIEGTGTQYINTGFYGTQNSGAYIRFALTDLTSNGSPRVFGTRNGNSGTGAFSFISSFDATTLSNDYFYLAANGSNTSSRTLPINTEWNEVSSNVENDKKTYFNNNILFTGNSTAFTATAEVSIFRTYNRTSYGAPATAKISEVRIYEEAVLVHHYLPCRRDSDDELGMYDVVTDTFLTNSGTGTFIAGADVVFTPQDKINFTNASGYITGITSSDVTTALGYTPYSDSNPNGYTSNIGTVTSVNNTQPDVNGDVTLTIPTVNDGILTITQNGTSKGTFSANQSTNDTIALTDTTYNAFTGADGVNAGSSGLVPAPTATDNDKYLKGDGTWATVSGSSTDVQINGTSITSGGVANIVTNTAYNASSNKIATMSDLPASGANTDLSNLTATGEAHFQEPLVSGTNIKTINNTSILGSGDIDTKETFTIIYNVTTYQEVQDNIENKAILFKSSASSSTCSPAIAFSVSSGYQIRVFSGQYYTIYAVSSSGWTTGTQYNYQYTSNLVTSISSSSTDTQYPSAKVTYDSILKYNLIQDINTLSNGTIALNYTNSLHKRAVTANTTYTFSTSNLSLTNSIAYTFELLVTMSTVYTLTFPDSVTWQGGETPDMSTTGTYYFAFRTIDAGTTWHGSLEGKW